MALKGIVHGPEIIPPIILLNAVHGFGKSSWAASAGEAGFKPIFIATENVSQIDADKFPVAKTLEEFGDNLRQLKEEKHDYKCVVIDTLDFLETLVWEYICRTRVGDKGQRYSAISDFPYGKGYALADDVFGALFKSLQALRDERKMMVILLCHAGVRTAAEPGMEAYDTYQPKLHTNSKGAGVGATVQEMADVVLFGAQRKFLKHEDNGMQTRNVMTGVGERTLYTEAGAGWAAKNRYSLPPEIPLGDGKKSHFNIFWDAMLASEVFSKKEN